MAKVFYVTVNEISEVTYRVRAKSAKEALELCRYSQGADQDVEEWERSWDSTVWDDATVGDEEEE